MNKTRSLPSRVTQVAWGKLTHKHIILLIVISALPGRHIWESEDKSWGGAGSVGVRVLGKVTRSWRRLHLDGREAVLLGSHRVGSGQSRGRKEVLSSEVVVCSSLVMAGSGPAAILEPRDGHRWRTKPLIVGPMSRLRLSQNEDNSISGAFGE